MGYKYLKMGALIIYSIIGILATACFCKLLFFAIQPGQILGAWQKVLVKWDQKGYSIVKPLGHCEMCFCFWCNVTSWILFFAISDTPLGWMWVLHYLCYTCIGGIVSLYVLVKMFK